MKRHSTQKPAPGNKTPPRPTKEDKIREAMQKDPQRAAQLLREILKGK